MKYPCPYTSTGRPYTPAHERIYIYIYGYTYIYIYTAQIHFSFPPSLCLSLSLSLSRYIYIYIYMYKCIYMYIYIYIYIYTYVYMYICIYTFTYIHIHMYANRWGPYIRISHLYVPIPTDVCAPTMYKMLGTSILLLYKVWIRTCLSLLLSLSGWASVRHRWFETLDFKKLEAYCEPPILSRIAPLILLVYTSAYV